MAAFRKPILAIISFILTFIFSTSALAVFESKSQFFQRLKQKGFDHVIETSASQMGGMKVYELSDGEHHRKHEISSFVTYDDPVPELDYVFNDTQIIRGIVGTAYARAYKVGGVMVCYRVEGTYLASVHGLISCLMFPYNIDDVVDALTQE